MVRKNFRTTAMALAMVGTMMTGVIPAYAGTGVGAKDTNNTNASMTYDEAIGLEGDNEFFNEEGADKTASAETYVTMSKESAFTVVIPKHVELVKGDDGYGASYDVIVKNTDIRPDQNISVTVAGNIDINETTGSNDVVNFAQSAEISEVSEKQEDAMKSTVVGGGDDAIVYTTQGDLELAEEQEVITYTLAEQSLHAGSWLGNTTFTVSLNDVTPVVAE